MILDPLFLKPQFSPDLATQEQIENHSLLRFTIGTKPLARFEGNEKNGQHNGILFFSCWLSRAGGFYR